MFSACLWWSWRRRNSMCLSNEPMPLNQLSFYIQNSIEDISSSFSSMSQAVPIEKHVRWNNNNFDCHILNVDGSCIGNPIRAGFGGLIRNSAGLFLAGFSGFLPFSTDILQAELTTIYHGLSMAKERGIPDLVRYSDSLLSINLIVGNPSRYHVHAVLIQEIKELLSQANYTIVHTLREGNHCADLLAKCGALSDTSFHIHHSPPDDLLPLLKTDAFLFLCFSFSFFLAFVTQKKSLTSFSNVKLLFFPLI